MGDSDNNTTLPLVTRRRVLAGTAFAMVGWRPKAYASNDLEKDQSPDPAVAVWRKWQAAHRQTEQLCRQQQRLEQKLVETIGFPNATILLRDGESVTLHSLQALHEVLDLGPEDMAKREKAEADLAAHQVRWDAADREICYSATLRAEREAGDRAEDLLEVLSETPATSLTGVAAKLDAALMEGESSEDDAEFPWPQIRSARDDLIRIGKEVVPEQVFPDEIRQRQTRRRREEIGFSVAPGSDGGAA
ncbi:hypothetical protein [Mesorhizobium sp.]|uniref:hypothetical protein n=1 Tax=Mesorhizobium sp. TaxID=1871066 RepID=UPI0025BD97CD|nr:hypothetical protein [Mesorhizobium sp.]